MATIVSAPGGRRASSIAPAPSYAGVVGKYANDIATAIENETNNRINNLVLQWKQGTLSWDDFLTQYQAEIDLLPTSSSKRTTLETNLLSYQDDHHIDIVNAKRAELTSAATKGDNLVNPLEQYNIERQLLALETPGSANYVKQQDNVVKAYEDALNYTVENKRTELLKVYSSGGITNAEELTINLQLQKLAPPESQTYQKLIAEEAQIRTNVQAEAKTTAGSTVGAAVEEASQKDITLFGGSTPQGTIPGQYAQGQVSGLQAEQASLANWQKVLDLYQSTGYDKQAEGKTVSTIQEIVNRLTTDITERQAGTRFDVMGKNGITSTTLSDVIAGRVDVLDPSVRYNQQNGRYEAYNPTTGVVEYSNKDENKVNNYATTKLPGVISVRDENGNLQKYYYDTKQGSPTYNKFISVKDGKVNVYASIPSTAEQEQKFNITQPTGPAEPKFNYFTNLKQNFAKVGEMRETAKAGAKEFYGNLGNKVINFAKSQINPPKPEVNKPVTMANLGNPLVNPIIGSGAITALGGIFKPVVNWLSSLGQPKTTNVNNPQPKSLLSNVFSGISNAYNKVKSTVSGIFK